MILNIYYRKFMMITIFLFCFCEQLRQKSNTSLCVYKLYVYFLLFSLMLGCYRIITDMAAYNESIGFM